LKHCGFLDFDGASQQCQSVGAQLVKISDAHENDFVRRLCGMQSCRLGLLEDEDLTHWRWPDDSTVGQRLEWRGYTAWSEGEPRNPLYNNDDSVGCAVMSPDFKDEFRALQNEILRQKMTPIVTVWAFVQIALPAVLFIASVFSSKCHSACLAQLVCIITGVGSVAIGFEILVWCLSLRHLNKIDPFISAPIVILLMVLACMQILLACFATSKAQELQWTTTVAWSPMGTSSTAAEMETGSSLATELTAAPVYRDQQE